MQKIFSELATALRERLEIIADEASRLDATRHMARLATVSEKIEHLERRIPKNADPQLRHFLQRRSYNKALELVETL